MGHDQRTHQTGRDAPRGRPHVFELALLVDVLHVERLGEVLAQEVRRTALQRLAVLHQCLDTYPAAWTEIVSPEGVRTALKIYQAEKRPAAHELPVGTIRTNRKSYIDIAVEDGYLRLLSVQLAGKKRLPVTDFLNGFKQIGEYKVD